MWVSPHLLVIRETQLSSPLPYEGSVQKCLHTVMLGTSHATLLRDICVLKTVGRLWQDLA